MIKSESQQNQNGISISTSVASAVSAASAKSQKGRKSLVLHTSLMSFLETRYTLYTLIRHIGQAEYHFFHTYPALLSLCMSKKSGWQYLGNGNRPLLEAKQLDRKKLNSGSGAGNIGFFIGNIGVFTTGADLLLPQGVFDNCFADS